MDRADPNLEPADQDRSGLALGMLQDLIGFRLRRVQNHLARRVAEERRDRGRTDVRPGAFSALALIAANPGVSQILLAREVGLDKATVVAVLDNLEELGWAERRRSRQDRRRHALYATADGEAALLELHAAAATVEIQAQSALSPGERRRLFRLLDKVFAACCADGAG